MIVFCEPRDFIGRSLLANIRDNLTLKVGLLLIIISIKFGKVKKRTKKNH